MDALVIGGTRFIGRFTVEELLDHGYEVAIFNRGSHDNPFADESAVEQVTGDRTVTSDLEAARELVDPDVVIDCVAYEPREVRAATEVFADVDAYVYVSSGAAYGAEEIPKREGETALEPCTDEQATDDSHETYGARKAEGDRAVFAAADRGVNAMSVRPTIVYGPHDYTGRFDYWVDRVVEHDRVLVPGDGDALWHLASVENVARALRTVAEAGTPGRAYNVGDRRLLTLSEFVELVADAAGADVELVTAGPRELAGDVDPDAVPFYRRYPHVLDTERLAALGWDPVAPETAIERTVDAALAAGPSPADGTPDPAAEQDVMDRLGE
ncbi:MULTISPECIES: NAD-dependent epimerase/dehydratase family protein [Salinibaculum]|uniref:NAD-dependent epimerase/dehydratase family protein n=1 Tax=Salinibaculum TaxID=2732368 RepID=UPI0030D4E2E6